MDSMQKKVKLSDTGQSILISATNGQPSQLSPSFVPTLVKRSPSPQPNTSLESLQQHLPMADKSKKSKKPIPLNFLTSQSVLPSANNNATPGNPVVTVGQVI